MGPPNRALDNPTGWSLLEDSILATERPQLHPDALFRRRLRIGTLITSALIVAIWVAGLLNQ